MTVAVGITFSISQKAKQQTPSVRLISEGSYYSDFEVVDDQVLICCRVTIENPTTSDLSIRIIADFPDDVAAGLLADAQLFAVDSNTGEATFVIPANSRVTIDITFLGEFAGTAVKHDRMLPSIEVIIVEG